MKCLYVFSHSIFFFQFSFLFDALGKSPFILSLTTQTQMESLFQIFCFCVKIRFNLDPQEYDTHFQENIYSISVFY